MFVDFVVSHLFVELCKTFVILQEMEVGVTLQSRVKSDHYVA